MPDNDHDIMSQVCEPTQPAVNIALHVYAYAKNNSELVVKICGIVWSGSLILDNERWKQADVPLEFQELVDHISTSGSVFHTTSQSQVEYFTPHCNLGTSHHIPTTGGMLLLHTTSQPQVECYCTSHHISTTSRVHHITSQAQVKCSTPHPNRR